MANILKDNMNAAKIPNIENIIGNTHKAMSGLDNLRELNDFVNPMKMKIYEKLPKY